LPSLSPPSIPLTPSPSSSTLLFQHSTSEMIIRILLSSILLFGSNAGSIFEQSSKGRCVPMQHKMCSDIPYNMTYYPNPISATEQSQIDHFTPLIKTKCHVHIKFFVCSVFEPMCPDQMPQAVTACRSVCEEVKRECLSILEEFGIAWPELLECSKFPVPPDLCMQPVEGMGGQPTRPTSHSLFPRISSSQSCPAFLVDTDDDDPFAPCALPCTANVLFSAMHKTQLHKWMPSLAGVSVALNTFTFLAFLIDRSRFGFPERCIFYMALCNLCYSLPFLVVGLDPTMQPACSTLTPAQSSHLLLYHIDSSLCTLSFFVVYYFSMAFTLWWFMFGYTWYLSAYRKWAPEALEDVSVRVHVVAWFAPLVGAIVVVTTHSVDSSELTGLCGVGNTDRAALLFYSALPRATIGCVGILFLLTGIASTCSERNNFRRRGTDTSKNDKLMLKTCIFSILYVVPWLTLLATDLYHYAQLQAWQDSTIGCKQSESPCLSQPPRANGDMYLVQVLAPLCAFLGPFIWAFSPKTFSSFHRRLCCCLWNPVPSKTPSRPLLDASAGGSGMGGGVPNCPLPSLPQPPASRRSHHNNQYAPLSTSSQPWAQNHV
ncbi:hypothetical protein PFISCL1PPCAC_20382, partial [Pristionchus fissidentatus]